MLSILAVQGLKPWIIAPFLSESLIISTVINILENEKVDSKKSALSTAQNIADFAKGTFILVFFFVGLVFFFLGGGGGGF